MRAKTVQGLVLLLLLLAAGPAAMSAPVIEITFLSPAPDTPLFGEVDFAVQVGSDEPVDRVEIFVDGKLVGQVRKPPYRVRHDVGQENVGHEVRAVVHTVSGSSASAALSAPKLTVDEELNVQLRQLFVTVVGAGDERRLDLGRDDFRVIDNGVEQSIVTFERGDVPFNAVLLLDTSESMKGSRLEAARAGVGAFLQGMKPVDEASLVLFSDRLLASTPFTSDLRELRAALEGTEAEGGTAVGDHLFLALKLLDGQVGRGTVILLSDGFDVQSVLEMKDVLWKARRSQALIYWIQVAEKQRSTSYVSAWRDAAANETEYRDLVRVVEESGGRIEKIASFGDLDQAFRGILAELRDQYVIGYYPSTTRGDGAWHEVKVRVRGGAAQARARGGYVDH